MYISMCWKFSKNGGNDNKYIIGVYQQVCPEKSYIKKNYSIIMIEDLKKPSKTARMEL